MSTGDPRLEAFPVWAMGQVLLPVQFHALQQALLSQIAVRAELEGLPAHGVSRVKLREGMLESEGSIALERLTYVSRRPFPVIDIPGNTSVNVLNVSPFVARVEAEGRLAIYLHVLSERRDTRRHERGPYVDDDAELGRELFTAELSVESTHDQAQMAGLLLFELERVRGQWSIGGFAPALARLGGVAMPYLDARFRAIQQTLRVVLGQIEQNIKDDYLSREHISEQRRVRGAARRVLQLFDDLGLGDADARALGRHPYLVFRELRDFYIDTASNLEHPLEPTPAYDHDDLRGCFSRIHEQIARLELSASLSSNSLRFERDADHYKLDRLPETLATAREVFLIIKFGSEEARPREDADRRAFIGQFKLASAKAVDGLVTRSLPGVGLDVLDEVSGAIFAPKFGSGAMSCRLDVRDPEWTRAMTDKNLRIPITRRLDYLTLYLVWSEVIADAEGQA